MRASKALIFLDRFNDNLQQIQALAPNSKIMAVVKANAYGHGFEPTTQYLEKHPLVQQFAVALVEEGILLRKIGIKKPILVLGGIFNENLKDALINNLEISVTRLEQFSIIESLAEQQKIQAQIHIKIDTGMERVGFNGRDMGKICSTVSFLKYSKIKALYSHLACSDDPYNETTSEQCHLFLQLCQVFKKKTDLKPEKHIANSGGILYFPRTCLDYVRAGIMLYGSFPSFSSKQDVTLKPLMELHSQICFVKQIKKGTPVSYGHTWHAKENTYVATVPIGYGDGYQRTLSNTGKVFIQGKIFPVIGRVCMDQILINTGTEKFSVGEPVILLGSSLRVEDLSKLAQTIPHEILSGITERIPRAYIHSI